MILNSMRRFRLLSYEKLFYSPLAQVEILNRVQGTIVTPISQWQELWKPETSQPYYGYVDIENGFFDIERPVNRRNKLFPLIEGITEASPVAGSGTFVRLRMRLPELTHFFAIFWFSGVGLGCIAVILARPATWFSLIPFLMFGAALLSFWMEVWSVKRLYSKLLQLVEISEIA